MHVYVYHIYTRIFYSLLKIHAFLQFHFDHFRCDIRIHEIHENDVTFLSHVRLPCGCWELPSLWKNLFSGKCLARTVRGGYRLNLMMHSSRSKSNRPRDTSVFTLALVIRGCDFYRAMTLHCVMVWVIKLQRCFVFRSRFEYVENSWPSGTGRRYRANIWFFESTICTIKSNVHDGKYDDGSDC